MKDQCTFQLVEDTKEWMIRYWIWININKAIWEKWDKKQNQMYDTAECWECQRISLNHLKDIQDFIR